MKMISLLMFGVIALLVSSAQGQYIGAVVLAGGPIADHQGTIDPDVMKEAIGKMTDELIRHQEAEGYLATSEIGIRKGKVKGAFAYKWVVYTISKELDAKEGYGYAEAWKKPTPAGDKISGDPDDFFGTKGESND